MRDWDTFVTAGADFLEQAAVPYPTVADSPAFWLYTSGTTGTPKGAMHRHGSLRDTAETYARDVLAIGPDDVTFSVAKFFFAYGLGNTLTFPFSVGASTVLDRSRPSPAGTLRILREHRPTLFFGGPTYYAALLARRAARGRFAGVRECVSAGEAFPAALLERFTSTFGVEMLDGIGSTEMLHIFISNRPGRVRPGTSGEVVAGYDAQIQDDDGQPVPDGTPGTSTCAAAPRRPATGAAPRSPAGCSRARGCAPATPTCARPTATTPPWAAPTTSSRPAASGSPRPRSRSGCASTPT